MEGLIKRLEQASEPSIELDEEIRVAIGAESINHGAGEGLMTTADCYGPPAYTASLDVALTLVPEGMWWLLGAGRIKPTEPLYGAQIRKPGFSTGGHIVSNAEHDHMAIALCLAALKARAAVASPLCGGEK